MIIDDCAKLSLRQAHDEERRTKEKHTNAAGEREYAGKDQQEGQCYRVNY